MVQLVYTVNELQEYRRTFGCVEKLTGTVPASTRKLVACCIFSKGSRLILIGNESVPGFRFLVIGGEVVTECEPFLFD